MEMKRNKRVRSRRAEEVPMAKKMRAVEVIGIEENREDKSKN